MYIKYKNIDGIGDYVEVFAIIEDVEIKIDEMRYIFIEPQKENLENQWLDKGKRIFESNKKYSEYRIKDEKAEKVANDLKGKHPKKDIWIGTSKEEVWIYHKNGNVMKIVNIEEYFTEKRRNRCQN